MSSFAKEFASIVPAAFATGPQHTLSDRYGFVPTFEVVEAFADHGWLPSSAKQIQGTRRDPNYIAHSIVLRHEDTKQDGREQIPQILLLNSHNGTTKLKIYAGLYRFVCANGLVVGDTKFKAELMHKGSIRADVGRYADSFGAMLGELNGTIEAWRAKELSEERAVEFAARAIKLRFDTKAGAYVPEDVLAARRAEDDGRSLWQVYNTVQEHTVKGGLRGFNANNRRVVTRELTGINQDAAYNDALWNLAAEFAAA